MTVMMTVQDINLDCPMFVSVCVCVCVCVEANVGQVKEKKGGRNRTDGLFSSSVWLSD